MTESVSYLGPKIWDLVPHIKEQSETLNTFDPLSANPIK